MPKISPGLAAVLATIDWESLLQELGGASEESDWIEDMFAELPEARNAFAYWLKVISEVYPSATIARSLVLSGMPKEMYASSAEEIIAVLGEAFGAGFQLGFQAAKHIDRGTGSGDSGE